MVFKFIPSDQIINRNFISLINHNNFDKNVHEAATQLDKADSAE